MKIVAAKCPSCGANIEVDKDGDKTKCEYCHTQILVEDAIAKIKVEHSGTIKIDGIKTDNDKLKNAKKHIKIEEYGEAIYLLNEIIENDSFNIEAYSLLVDSYTGYIKQIEDKNPEWFNDAYYLNKENLPFYDDYLRKLESLNKDYERLKKIDENKEFVNNIANEELVKKYLDLYKEKTTIFDKYVKLVKLLEKLLRKNGDYFADYLHEKYNFEFEYILYDDDEDEFNSHITFDINEKNISLYDVLKNDSQNDFKVFVTSRREELEKRNKEMAKKKKRKDMADGVKKKILELVSLIFIFIGFGFIVSAFWSGIENFIFGVIIIVIDCIISDKLELFF